MKLKFGIIYLHRHGMGAGGPGKLYPMIKNEHKLHHPMSTDLENNWLSYPFMGFRQIWPPARERRRSSRMKSY